MLPYLPKTAPERIPKDFALQKGTASKRAGNQTLRRAQSADGLETWTFPTGYESGDDLARKPPVTKVSSGEFRRSRYLNNKLNGGGLVSPKPPAYEDITSVKDGTRRSGGLEQVVWSV